MFVGSLILVPAYVVQYLSYLGLLNQVFTVCMQDGTGPSGIQDRRVKRCKRRLPVEEEEELVLEGDNPLHSE